MMVPAAVAEVVVAVVADPEVPEIPDVPVDSVVAAVLLAAPVVPVVRTVLPDPQSLPPSHFDGILAVVGVVPVQAGIGGALQKCQEAVQTLQTADVASGFLGVPVDSAVEDPVEAKDWFLAGTEQEVVSGFVVGVATVPLAVPAADLVVAAVGTWPFSAVAVVVEVAENQNLNL